MFRDILCQIANGTNIKHNPTTGTATKATGVATPTHQHVAMIHSAKVSKAHHKKPRVAQLRSISSGTKAPHTAHEKMPPSSHGVENSKTLIRTRSNVFFIYFF